MFVSLMASAAVLATAEPSTSAVIAYSPESVIYFPVEHRSVFMITRLCRSRTVFMMPPASVVPSTWPVPGSTNAVRACSPSCTRIRQLSFFDSGTSTCVTCLPVCRSVAAMSREVSKGSRVLARVIHCL